ncbi:MAG: peptide deformylase [bacterium]
MSILPIYLLGTGILRKKAKPVQSLDNSIIKLAFDMTETMRKANGIGLAAPQVGELKRVIVIDQGAAERAEEETEEESPPPAPKEQKTLVLINPEIQSAEGEWTMEEGCLSIPDIRAEVTRPEIIRLLYRDVNFQQHEINVSGLLARVILHEMDHLDGVLFIDHISRTKRVLLRSELKQIQNGEVETAYPIVSAVEV